MKTFTYSADAPRQAVSLRVAKSGGQNGETKLVNIDLVPGRPVELPEDHTFTRTLIGGGSLLDANGKAIKNATKIGKAVSQEKAEAAAGILSPAQFGALTPGDPKRVARLVEAFDHVVDEDRTAKGEPTVTRASELVGFKVTAEEIQAAHTAWKKARPKTAQVAPNKDDDTANADSIEDQTK